MPTVTQLNNSRLQDMLAKIKAKQAAEAQEKEAKSIALQEESKELAGVQFQAPTYANTPTESFEDGTLDEAGRFQIGNKVFFLNSKQMDAVRYAEAGRAICLIGAAGTGKTTTVKKMVLELMKRVPKGKEKEAIAIVSFTNRAVKNVAKAVTDSGAAHLCTTIHKLLGFHPEDCSYVDSTGEVGTHRLFVPEFTAENPLTGVKLVVVEESSMVSTHLFKQLYDACPNAEFIFLGDLNQLPPVFGDAVLGFKLSELPVVELTEVYRQAMESPIIGFQHKYTLKGMLPSDSELAKISEENRGLTFRPLKKRVDDDEHMVSGIGDFFRREYETGKYRPLDCVILIPYNKKVGTILLNKHIAQFLGDSRNAEVHEIIAGYEKQYFAEGDLVIYNRNEYWIDKIAENPRYLGAQPKMASTGLTRFGNYRDGSKIDQLLDSHVEGTTDFQKMLNYTPGLDDEEEDAENACSHILTLRSVENTNSTTTISSRGDINSTDFAYAITIHKAQGSEWRKVYLIMTKHHAPMLSRELLYTGMTRAREELEVIYEPQTAIGRKDSSIAKAIKRQTIPGNHWKDKVEFFKGKQGKYNSIMSGETEIQG